MNYFELAQRMLEMSESELENCLNDLKPSPKLLADFYRVYSKKWGFGLPSLDIVGTGGDGKNSFNISTASSIVLASSGVPVTKFGNRAATSTSGSMDVLDCLGITTCKNKEEAFQQLRENNLCFLNAREIYSEFSKFANVRRKIKKPTVFNYLGPLLNPFSESYTVLGIYNTEFEKIYLSTFKLLGKENFTIVNGKGQDEAVPFNQTRILSNRKNYLLPRFSEGKDNDLKVDSPQESAKIIREIFSGKDRSVRRDTVILNSAIAHSQFFDNDFQESYDLIERLISSGKTNDFLLKFRNV